jgi:cyclophilin family peptidyl-prolyl cis-trans isomerase
MKKWIVLLGFLGLVPLAMAQNTPHPRVRLTTSMGVIELALNADAAPATVDNFLAYVRSGFYNGTIFHRVIKGFMIQGGGLTSELQRKPTRPPIPNEADNGLKNLRGTIAMARTLDPHSATAQFFINVADNRPLDHRDKSPRGWGYCVFGRVIDGMQVVSAIENAATGTMSGFRDVPIKPIVILKAQVIQPSS